ncbi:unnamed protein product [Adineta steineri]|uniref:Uncharacterized protein n=1 Tax=Adineta steineri TaxID=433720 RepID=A0A813TSN9_9BILA|nr:unnamed protein product [Adineta steineri]CAF4120245.1 unnamed protein product [Adineta steineri]
MDNELDRFIEDCNTLQEKINTITQNKDFNIPLLTEIDDWEKMIIEKVKKVAEQVREQVIKLPNEKEMETKFNFEKYRQNLNQLKETGDFVEYDLKYLEQTVYQLNQDLKRLNQSLEFELCKEQSNQIQWDSLIYIKEKPSYTLKQPQQQQVNEQTQVFVSSRQVTLDCGGHSCTICNKCCDWNRNVKRAGATCTRNSVGPCYTAYCDCPGSCHCSYNNHIYSDVCNCAENK